MFNKPNRKVDRVFIHCSASDVPAHDNAATIRDWHVNGNGWNDIGYHYFIRKSGQLEDGRDLEKTPAAQGGNNRATIAICLHGLDEHKFTQAQFDKLRGLAVEINNAYAGAVTFHGHREVAAKACPVFDYKTVLQLDAFGRLGLAGAVNTPLQSETGRNPVTMPVLRQGSRGPSVALAQKLLMVKDDGVFGPRTDDAVRGFQSDNGLGRDGVIGKNTWRKLFQNTRVVHDEVQ